MREPAELLDLALSVASEAAAEAREEASAEPGVPATPGIIGEGEHDAKM